MVTSAYRRDASSVGGALWKILPAACADRNSESRGLDLQHLDERRLERLVNVDNACWPL
jgi:hypothetical protein